MVDEVEIKNVGGRYGVASEATLAALLQAMQSSPAGPRGGADQSRRIQDLFSRSQRDHTRANRSLIGAIADVTKTTLVSGQRTSDFARTIANGDGILTTFFGFLDDNIDMLRTLSSSGASFNNSIFDMIESSAESAMNLTDFANMVKQNGDKLASFGGTVTNGSKLFGTFSKNFRSGVGSQFFEMGFTIEDVNEGLMSFMDIERKRSNQELKFDSATQASAAEYILQLDKLAKLTGEERKQLADRMAVQQQDAGVRNQLNKLNADQAMNLSTSLAFFESQLPGMSEGFKDLMDGVAQTDMGKAMESAMPGIREYMQRVFTGEESLDEVLSTLQSEFGPALEDFTASRSKAEIDQMKASGGVVGALGELMDSLYQLNAISALDAKAADAEQKRRNKVTSLMGKFEQALVTIRSTFLDAFLDSDLFKSLSDFGTSLNESLGNRSGGMGWFAERLTQLFNYIDDKLSWAIGWVTDSLEEGGALDQAFDYLEASILAAQTWFDGFVADVQSQGLWVTVQQEFDKLLASMKENFYSYFGLDGDKPLAEQLYTNMSNAFTQFWEGPYGSQIADNISKWFEELIDKITAKVTGSGEASGTSISTGEGMGTGVLSQGVYSATGGLFGGGDRKGMLDPEAFLNQAEDWMSDRSAYSLLGESRSEIEDTARSWISDTLNHLMSPEGGGLSKEIAKNQIRQGLMDFMATPGRYSEKDFETMNKYMTETVIPRLDSFSNGTSGFQNFGNESTAKLHGVEAVVPRNTMAGDLLSRTFGNDWNSPKANQSSAPTSSNQESLVKHVNQLNNTMLMVLSEIRTSNDLGKKTISSVKGLNGDLYRGI